MHERLEKHAREFTRFFADEYIRRAINEQGYERVLNVIAFHSIQDRNFCESEGDDPGKAAYANLAFKLLKAVDEHEL